MQNQTTVFQNAVWRLIAFLWLLASCAIPLFAQDAGEASTAQAGLSNTLDGKTFITLEEEPDELIFADGTFFSTKCSQWGFEPSRVTVTEKGDVIRFETESVSPEHGKMVWQGIVSGNTMEGSYEWTKKRWYWKDAHQVTAFKATLKNL